jgi:hypothetical protein
LENEIAAPIESLDESIVTIEFEEEEEELLMSSTTSFLNEQDKFFQEAILRDLRKQSKVIPRTHPVNSVNLVNDSQNF